MNFKEANTPALWNPMHDISPHVPFKVMHEVFANNSHNLRSRSLFTWSVVGKYIDFEIRFLLKKKKVSVE